MEVSVGSDRRRRSSNSARAWVASSIPDGPSTKSGRNRVRSRDERAVGCAERSGVEQVTCSGVASGAGGVAVVIATVVRVSVAPSRRTRRTELVATLSSQSCDVSSVITGVRVSVAPARRTRRTGVVATLSSRSVEMRLVATRNNVSVAPFLALATTPQNEMPPGREVRGQSLR